MKCANCLHDESEHETVEYRGDKQRACLHRRVPAARCLCREYRPSFANAAADIQHVNAMDFLSGEREDH